MCREYFLADGHALYCIYFCFVISQVDEADLEVSTSVVFNIFLHQLAWALKMLAQALGEVLCCLSHICGAVD